ncbi:hypothetical protein DACRYDRAFT_119897 [Dacryopinax primogenitus]|uniref:Uncharacterized protein n=1 Tax=Dacryopinax primogenitus (strain DJM 731) TaxID=1858805 RepID=M5FNZ7_DACPD|nr:uncharacterized protein DACRYDRAFT_119897 [Dacryopinax primogenitus]EJT96668.1 hypothetical protein DACRYDRAFT_119897 [Dacryopinax primogenitus]
MLNGWMPGGITDLSHQYPDGCRWSHTTRRPSPVRRGGGDHIASILDATDRSQLSGPLDRGLQRFLLVQDGEDQLSTSVEGYQEVNVGPGRSGMVLGDGRAEGAEADNREEGAYPEGENVTGAGVPPPDGQREESVYSQTNQLLSALAAERETRFQWDVPLSPASASSALAAPGRPVVNTAAEAATAISATASVVPERHSQSSPPHAPESTWVHVSTDAIPASVGSASSLAVAPPTQFAKYCSVILIEDDQNDGDGAIYGRARIKKSGLPDCSPPDVLLCLFFMPTEKIPMHNFTRFLAPEYSFYNVVTLRVPSGRRFNTEAWYLQVGHQRLAILYHLLNGIETPNSLVEPMD